MTSLNQMCVGHQKTLGYRNSQLPYIHDEANVWTYDYLRNAKLIFKCALQKSPHEWNNRTVV